MHRNSPAGFSGCRRSLPLDGGRGLGGYTTFWGKPVTEKLNKTVPVPVFYSGGELSPLPELPCQKDSALERVQYVAEVNRLKRSFSGLSVEQKDTWEDLQMHGNPVMSDQGQKENCYAFDASIQSCYVSQ